MKDEAEVLVSRSEERVVAASRMAALNAEARKRLGALEIVR